MFQKDLSLTSDMCSMVIQPTDQFMAEVLRKVTEPFK